jgi:hypothetical protein
VTRIFQFRYVTAAIVIFCCALTSIEGARVLLFVSAESRLLSQPNVTSDDIRGWYDVPGVQLQARSALLNYYDNNANQLALTAKRDQLIEVLSVAPMAPSQWVALAWAQFLTGEPRGNMLKSLTMSVLTGRNEGSVMIDRAIFGASTWELLPPESRQRIITDLAATAETMFDNERVRLINIFNGKTKQSREEIRTALAGTTGISHQALDRVGLGGN